MKKFAFLLILISGVSFAQDLQQHIAALKKELKSKPNVERTTQIYSDLTWDYMDVSLDSAIVYGEKALALAHKTKKHQLISQCYSNLGGVYLRKENFIKSEENYKKAIQIRTLNKDFEGVAKVKINIGNVLASKQDYVPATKYFIEAIQYFEGKNDTIVSLTKGNLGLIFFEMKNFPKAIKYLEESTDFLKKNNMQQGLCHTYLSLGDVYLDKKDTLKALNSYQISLENCKSCKDNLGISTLNQRIGAVHSAKGKSENAKKYYQISEKLLKELNSEIEQTNVMLSKSEDFIQQKKYREAYEMLLKVKKIHKEYDSDRYLLETYKKLTLVCLYQEMKDSSAYYFNKYTNLKDEKLKASVLEQTAELETKYQTAEKEKQLLQKEAETKKKTTTIIILSLLIFFLAIVGFLIYRQQRLKNVQQKQEFELQSAIVQIENQNKLQEQRLAISRDLHDNIGAQLTFIISSVENLKFGFPAMETSVKNHLTKISDFTKTTIVELRDTIWAMNANEFTFDDLSSRIYNFIEKAQSAKENTTFKFTVDDRLKNYQFSSLEGVNLYRTIQEAVNNAIKYADATEISVQVEPSRNGISIIITDNGKGFEVHAIEVGNGIVNMQKRIEEIGGIFKIQSELTKGTRVAITLNKES
ncbi:tetratricopeptide repeat-containing sensor histidine kinase [Flavobacterium luminosum]|uniref:histidine kinase n=1 Tax=Flavobacterium luminosum TaxID=2949086 RepID=A0ABT0TPE6_9FLAO|nr:tetratricopeptide repeat-containing sensor histidine kinase [Flavobacterium sp. HXWNR70]MCL9808738.1 ATP-binding protein [Flavobacterium sp. HXWNR70]